MGKRSGIRTPKSLDRSILRRRILSMKLSSATDPKSVAADLIDRYPDYRGRHHLPLAAVTQTLHSLNPTQTPAASDSADSDDVDGRSGPHPRRQTRPDKSEHRLSLLESARIRKLRQSRPATSDTSTSTSDEVVFEQKFEPDEVVFEQKFEPEFDVTKSLLRDRYAKQQKPPPVPVNMEIDDVDDKKKQVMEVGAVREVSSLPNGGGEEKGGPRFKDLGGMDGVIDELMMEVIVPLCFPELPRMLGVRPMAGVLLHGPPGCGKTKLAHAIANETGVPFYKISATEVVSGVSGASEENIRDLFKKAYRTAPSIVFIDEIDAIASKRENLQREMERRIVTQLMTCMDELHQTLKSGDAYTESEEEEKKPGYVLVIGATNRPDAMDQALRRPGRFDREIVLGVPDENARKKILSVLTRNLKLEGTLDLFKIARATPGFVGADLAALANKAGNLAMKRIIDRRKSELCKDQKDSDAGWWRQPWTPEEMESLNINMADFEEATKLVQPSSRREGFSSIPNVKWEDVGGLTSLREEFERYIVQRIKNPEDYADFGVNLAVGFLLYGPPGCGKTLIAKAVANEAGANFIHIKGPELLNKYVGESELAVRTIFTRARTCAPCILFFDEVDALTTKRGQEREHVTGLLNQLLIELDGSDQRQGVYVIGATNRLEVIDTALLRPGRFGKKLYVPLPNAEERGLILKALAKHKPISVDVDLDAIACREACSYLSGADLSAVMNEAAMAAMEDRHKSMQCGGLITEPRVINTSHFDKALEKVTPSVSVKQSKYYEALSQEEKSKGRA